MLKQIATYSWLTTFLSLLLAMLFLTLELLDYGFTLFVIFPLALGFSSALTYGNTFKARARLLYMSLGVLAFILVASIFQLEGTICLLMGVPIMAILIVIGFWIGVSVMRRIMNKDAEANNHPLIAFMPLIILFIGNNIESLIRDDSKVITVITSVVLPYTTQEVFDGVKSMDTLDGTKPFLINLGLPIPKKCILEDTVVGATRVCLFDQGEIVTKVTEYKPKKILRMQVVQYSLAGSRWFTFNDALYTLDENLHGTKITRTTTYTSQLKPRIYWKPLEKIAVQQEHMFVLNSLRKNLGNRVK